MATVKINAWDVAELLGLSYEGFHEYTDKYGDVRYGHNFDFHGKVISVNEWVHDTSEKAQEAVAADLLLELGKKLSKIID